MTPSEHFLQRIGNLRKQTIRRSVTRVVADTFMFSLLFNTGAIALQKTRMIVWEGWAIYPLLVLLAICLSLLIELRTREHLMDELIDIDLRFKLREKVSSAYECLKLGRKSIFVDLLVADAWRFLSRMKAREIVPTRLFLRHGSIPALALAMVLVLTIDFRPARTELNMGRETILDQIAVQLEGLSSEGRDHSEKVMKKEEDNLFEKMEELERHLRNRSMNHKKAIKALRQLLEQAQEAQANLASQLVEELSLQKIEGVPSLEPGLKKGIPAENLAKAEALFGKFFEGDIPADIAKKLLLLRRYNETQQFLASMMNEIQPDLSTGSTQERTGETSQGEPTEMAENAPFKRSGGGKTKARGGEEGGEEPGQRSGPVAGRGKDTQGRGPSHEIKGSKNVPLKDPTLQGPGKRYHVFIRSLPMVEKAKLQPEELIRSYRREIEEVLTNETIPLNYREYIRDYFLAIGVGREDHENE